MSKNKCAALLMCGTFKYVLFSKLLNNMLRQVNDLFAANLLHHLF